MGMVVRRATGNSGGARGINWQLRVVGACVMALQRDRAQVKYVVHYGA